MIWMFTYQIVMLWILSTRSKMTDEYSDWRKDAGKNRLNPLYPSQLCSGSLLAESSGITSPSYADDSMNNVYIIVIYYKSSEHIPHRILMKYMISAISVVGVLLLLYSTRFVLGCTSELE